MTMDVSIIGAGYVGLTTGAVLALSGHSVRCIDRNSEKVTLINAGHAPFYEPDLDDVLKKVTEKRRLVATTNLHNAVLNTDITIIAVGTPLKHASIDLSEIKTVARAIGDVLRVKRRYHVVTVKSTLLPGVTESVVKPILEHHAGKPIGAFGLCVNPEFLREGSALHDALYPDRVIIAGVDKKSATTYTKLFSNTHCPLIYTTITTAEMIKYVSNAMLATLISFSNEIGLVCAQTPGVDAVDVWNALYLDRRFKTNVINKQDQQGIIDYLSSGCGYGGSCLPKDTQALLRYARTLGVRMPILKEVITTNTKQPLQLLQLLENACRTLSGKRIAILGLAFKPQTDDLRESPALVVIEELLRRGSTIVCHDPQVYQKKIPTVLKHLSITLATNYSDALRGADAAVVVTAWDDYKKIMPDEFITLMKQPIVIDGRRLYDKQSLKRAGVRYKAIGLA